MRETLQNTRSGAPETACCCDRQHLTLREIEVLCAAADGHTSKQIAEKLNISRTPCTANDGDAAPYRRAQPHRSGHADLPIRHPDHRKYGPVWSGRRCLDRRRQV